MLKNKKFEYIWIAIIIINMLNVGSIFFNILNAIKSNKKETKEGMFVHNLDAEFIENYIQTQLERVRKRNVIRVAILNNKAYWVHDNIFYEAEIVDGRIQNDKAKQIDAHSASEKELDTLLDILDNISPIRKI